LTVEYIIPALKILKEPIYMLMFGIFTFMTTLAMLQINICVALRDAKYSFIQNLIAVSRIVILPFMAAFSILGLYLAYGLGILIAFLIASAFVKKLYQFYEPTLLVDWPIVKKLLRFSSGNYIASCFENSPTYLLPLLVINILGPEQNAYFFIAWSLSSLLLMIPRAISLSLFVEGSYEMEELKRNTKNALKLIFFLMIPSIGLISVFGKSMLSFFGQLYATNAYVVLLLFMLAGIPYSINVMYIAIYRVQKRIMPIICVQGVIAVLTLAGSYLLMQAYGLIGLGLSWAAANGIAAGTICVVYGIRVLFR